MIKRILVGLAGTTYTPAAIQYAVRLAQAHGAELTGVTVLNPQTVRAEGTGLTKMPGIAAIRDQRLQIAQTQVDEAAEEFVKACDAAGLTYRVVHETAEAFTSLADQARYHDLMVFGLRSIFEYNFLAGDADTVLLRLISQGVRPLLAVPETYRPISKVMIAYNGTMESAKAMKRFVQSGLWPRAQLRVITFNPSPEKADNILHSAEEYCRAHGHEVDHQTNPGQAKDLLLAAATLWQADMIVMGNSARSVLVRHILGDTLLNVLSQSDVPLFLAQ